MTDSYQIPTTNAEGLALVWTRIYPAELARQLSDLPPSAKNPNPKISRAATAKWKAVPPNRVDDVAKITGFPREHILPELFATA